jgi:uncharacterized protein YcaQ
VHGVHLEDGAGGEVTAPLAEELRRMAAWLGLERAAPSGRGQVPPELGRLLEP